MVQSGPFMFSPIGEASNTPGRPAIGSIWLISLIGKSQVCDWLQYSPAGKLVNSGPMTSQSSRTVAIRPGKMRKIRALT